MLNLKVALCLSKRTTDNFRETPPSLALSSRTKTRLNVLPLVLCCHSIGGSVGAVGVCFGKPEVQYWPPNSCGDGCVNSISNTDVQPLPASSFANADFKLWRI